MSKLKVPDGMLVACCEDWDTQQMTIENRCKSVLEAALRWLCDNPIVPSKSDMEAWKRTHPYDASSGKSIMVEFAEWWQRRMFWEPEPEVSEAELAGMERAAQLFDGLYWGPFHPPQLAIREAIKACRERKKDQ